MTNRKKQSPNYMLPLAAVICVISLMVMIAALTMGQKHEMAEFTPPPFDVTAQVGTPTVSEDLGWSELDAQAFKVSVCGVFAPENGSADIWLTDPENNTVWLKLRVLDTDGNILGETGLIRPGEYVQSVTLDKVPKSGASIVLKLMAYEPETYHSAGAASLNTTVK